MIPIYEQGSGQGIGHGREQFIKRFDEICAEHLEKRGRVLLPLFFMILITRH